MVQLTGVILNSEDPSVDSFVDVQDNCTNPDFFTDRNLDSDYLTSWDGYYFFTGYDYTLSLSDNEIGADGGTVILYYNIKNKNDGTPAADVIPEIKSEIGVVSNITKTDFTGYGTAYINVPSLEDYEKVRTLYTVTISSGGSGSSISFYQSANIKDDYSEIIVYGNYTGTLSLGKTVASAGDDSINVTYGKVYRTNTRTYYYTSGHESRSVSETDYYSGNVSVGLSLTYDPDSVGSYCSTTNSSVTNSSSTKSISITKGSYGCSYTRSQTYQVSLYYGQALLTTKEFTTEANEADVTNAITSNGSWTGTLSTNDSELYASSDSATITYGAVKRTNTRTYYSTSGSACRTTSETEYYSGTVYATLSLSSDPSNIGSYCSISSNSYTNSSSTDTASISKSSFGANATSAQTYKVDLRIGSSTGTSVKSITFKTEANVKNDYYDIPVIESVSYSKFASEGSTQTPSVSYYQQGHYTSGSNADKLTSGGSLNFTLSGTNFVLNNFSTGSISSYSNESLYEASGTVGVTVTLNGLTSSRYDCNISQSAGYYTYGDITISAFSYGNVSAEGGSSSPYITYTQPYG